MRTALADGLPCLGICLGMQLLFSESEEGPGEGLAFIEGRVERIRAERLPQIGWNALDDVAEPLFEQAALREGYYANSYVCRPRDRSVVTAFSTHEGDRYAASLRFSRTVGVQFHPEKSSTAGVNFVRAFIAEALA